MSIFLPVTILLRGCYKARHSCFLLLLSPGHHSSYRGLVGALHRKRIIIDSLLQVQAYGPGLEKSGCIVNNLAEFTVDPKDAGKAPLKILAQVSFQGPPVQVIVR